MKPATLYTILSGMCITACVIVALAGSGNADDLLAVALLGLAGTLVGRGKGNA